jgi:hypothetical protein
LSDLGATSGRKSAQTQHLAVFKKLSKKGRRRNDFGVSCYLYAAQWKRAPGGQVALFADVLARHWGPGVKIRICVVIINVSRKHRAVFGVVLGIQILGTLATAHPCPPSMGLAIPDDRSGPTRVLRPTDWMGSWGMLAIWIISSTFVKALPLVGLWDARENDDH